MNICMFCSAQDISEKYTNPAVELAQLLAKQGHIIIWDGINKGLMGLIADSVKKAGGKLVGISIEKFRAISYITANELIIVKDISERKKIMLQRANAFIVLPGGTGTLDEVTEMLEHRRHGVINVPIIILNTDNFFDGLKIQLTTMQNEKFLTMPLHQLAHFAKEPRDICEFLIRDK